MVRDIQQEVSEARPIHCHDKKRFYRGLVNPERTQLSDDLGSIQGGVLIYVLQHHLRIRNAVSFIRIGLGYSCNKKVKMETQTEKKLPIAFEKKWVAAHRSGKFKQGKSGLYDKEKDSYCCLGVACRVAGIPKEKIKGGYIMSSEMRGVSVVPKMLRGSGSHWDNTPNELAGQLAQMNDAGVSFKKIASHIEKNL